MAFLSSEEVLVAEEVLSALQRFLYPSNQYAAQTSDNQDHRDRDILTKAGQNTFT